MMVIGHLYHMNPLVVALAHDSRVNSQSVRKMLRREVLGTNQHYNADAPAMHSIFVSTFCNDLLQ